MIAEFILRYFNPLFAGSGGGTREWSSMVLRELRPDA